MIKWVLICAMTSLCVLAVYSHKVPESHCSSANSIKTIYLDVPSTEQIKKDLIGKIIVVDGKRHQLGQELNKVDILSINQENDDCVTVNVNVTSETNYLKKKGLFRVGSVKENVCGCLKLSYQRKDNDLTCQMIESVDVKKTYSER